MQRDPSEVGYVYDNAGRAPPGHHAHHVFPQKFRLNFEKVGINIDDPHYMQWWEARDHLKNAHLYNSKWENFFGKNSNPTRQQVLDYGREVMGEFGKGVLF